MTLVDGRSARRRAEKKRPRPRLSIVGILGELLITAGVVVLLFLGWQVWLNDIIVGTQQNDQAHELSESWSRGDGATLASPDRPLLLRADRSVPYGDVVGVIAAIKEAGINTLGMVTEPAPDARQSRPGDRHR